jgi:hypothetical protein
VQLKLRSIKSYGVQRTLEVAFRSTRLGLIISTSLAVLEKMQMLTTHSVVVPLMMIMARALLSKQLSRGLNDDSDDETGHRQV